MDEPAEPHQDNIERIRVEIADAADLAFDSVEELSEWIAEQREFWSWLSKPAAAASLPLLGSAPLKLWAQLDQIIQSFKQANDDASREAQRTKIHSILGSIYNAPVAFMKSDARAQYVDAIRLRYKPESTGNAVAVNALHALLNPTVEFPKPQVQFALRGFVHAFLYGEDNLTRSDAEASAVKVLKQDWDRLLVSARDAFEGFSNEYDTLQTDAHSATSAVTKLESDQTVAFANLIEESREKLDALEVMYKNKLALKEPVSYWSNRGNNHAWLAVLWAVLLGGAAWGFHDLLWASFHKMVLEPGDERHEYWQVIIMVVVVGTAVLWPLRILARLLLSSIHIWTDAKERATMANTYIALLQEDRAAVEGERRVIFEALFRSSRYGLVKDDAVPPSLVTIASAAATKAANN